MLVKNGAEIIIFFVNIFLQHGEICIFQFHAGRTLLSAYIYIRPGRYPGIGESNVSDLY